MRLSSAKTVTITAVFTRKGSSAVVEGQKGVGITALLPYNKE